MHRRIRSATTALILGTLGCGKAVEKDESVPLDQLPAEVATAAHKELPGYTLQSAYKIKVEGEAVFEIKGRNAQGKIREVEVTPTGKVLEVE